MINAPVPDSMALFYPNQFLFKGFIYRDIGRLIYIFTYSCSVSLLPLSLFRAFVADGRHFLSIRQYKHNIGGVEYRGWYPITYNLFVLLLLLLLLLPYRLVLIIMALLADTYYYCYIGRL